MTRFAFPQITTFNHALWYLPFLENSESRNGICWKIPLSSGGFQLL